MPCELIHVETERESERERGRTCTCAASRAHLYFLSGLLNNYATSVSKPSPPLVIIMDQVQTSGLIGQFLVDGSETMPTLNEISRDFSYPICGSVFI